MKGPLAVAWGDWTLAEPHAGAVTVARVELENTGTVAWRDPVLLSYHWLDLRDNPIVWDGERTSLPLVAPGERLTVEAQRAGSDPARSLPLRARPRRRASRVVLRARERARFAGGRGAARAAGRIAPSFPAWVEPAADWEERVAAAHAEGYAVVAGSIEWQGGLGAGAARRRSPPYEPGAGPDPGLRAAAPLPLGARRDRARAAARRRRAPGLRGAGRRAVGLRRPDRAARAARARRSRARSRAGRRRDRTRTSRARATTTAATAR